MFQFPGFPAYDYFIHHTLRGSSPRGFPHSDIRGSMLICSSPRLFAACHVLRRLPMPRHSPYALLRLNYLQQFVPASLGSRFSRKNCCVHTLQCFVWQNCFFFYPTAEKPDSEGSLPLSSCFPYLSVMYVSHAFFRIHMIHFSLIRFSMNIRPHRAS